MALDVCKIWKEPNGHLIITVFPISKMISGETEEQCVQRLTERLKQVNKYLPTLEEYTMKRSEFPNHPDKEKWRIGQDKKIYVDVSIETESEKRQKTKQKVFNKLKALGLTDEEVNLLVKNDI